MLQERRPVHYSAGWQRRVRSRFALATIIVACAGSICGGAIAATSASATDISYGPCPYKCAKIAGPVASIKDNEANNVYAKGVCTDIYYSYERREKCTEKENTVRQCLSFEVDGYGVSHRFYKQYEYYLQGREDNYSPFPACPLIEP